MNSAEPPERVRRPLMIHRWHQVAFIHWPYSPAAVQRLLPDGLAVETCDGQAWVGLIPFLLTVFPLLRAAPEINLRTYVRGPDGGRGIYFFSLELGRPLAALVARAGYRIPYFWSNVKAAEEGHTLVYASLRLPPATRASAVIEVDRGPALVREANQLELFLTARFTLYAGRRRLWRAQVEHPAWELHCATAGVSEDLTTTAGLPRPEAEPHVLFSPGTRALFGPPRRVGQTVLATEGTQATRPV